MKMVEIFFVFTKLMLKIFNVIFYNKYVMTANFSYRYGKTSKGIVFFLMFIWAAFIGFLPLILKAFHIINPEGMGAGGADIFKIICTVLPIFCSVIALIFLGFGIYRVKGAGKVKQILTQGKPAIGVISSLARKTVTYNGQIVTATLVFYYRFKDGRVGKTTQLIANRMFDVLNNKETREIPIKVLGDRAVLDETRL